MILPLALTTVAVPIPVYTEHDGVAVGEIRKAECTEEGLHVEGRIVDLAARRFAAADGQGLSIGFIGSGQKSGPVRIFTDVEIVEVSLCRQPVDFRLPSHHAEKLAHSRERNRAEHLAEGRRHAGPAGAESRRRLMADDLQEPLRC